MSRATLGRRVRRGLRRRRGPVGALVIVALFVLALVLYVGQDPATTSVAAPGVASAASTPTPRGPHSASQSASPSPTSGPSSSAGAAGGIGSLPLTPLPGQASDVRGGQPPASVVRMSVRSDATILRVGYLLKGGHPDSYYRALVRSPVSFRVIAHGSGLVAEIGAQAGPTAARISCSISIDGGPVTTHVAKGPYGFVACLG